MNRPPPNPDQFADTAELPAQKVAKPLAMPSSTASVAASTPTSASASIAAPSTSHEIEVMSKKGWHWPLIGSLPLEKQAVILRALAVIFIFTVAVLIGLQYGDSERQTVNSDIISQVRVNVTALQDQVENMLYARQVDMSQTKNLRDQLNIAIPALVQGGLVGQKKLSPASGNAIHPSLLMLKNWQMVDGQLDKILKQERSLTALKDLVGAVRNNGEEFLHSVEALADTSTKSDAPASRLLVVGQSLVKNIYSLALSPQVSPDAIIALNKESDTFSALLSATRSEKTQDLKRNYEDIQHMISLVASDPQALSQAKTTSAQVLADLPELAKAVGDLSDAHRTQMWPARLILVAAGALAFLTFCLLWSIEKITSQVEIARRQTAEEEKEKTQQAIRLLIEEIKGYADGDLTVRASVVPGKITEPLARTVNHTFEELGKLVKQVNSAAGRVTQAAVGARATSNELLQASESQNNEIQKTSRSVLNTVEQMHMVAARASESAKVALTSLEVADKGSRAVANSIRGMDDIRGRIQDTSKRLKRLGESSQEIGEIVALISDITEQTNVLALNAAIQAANAGEAGRGFGVVAEEVQRLAERSNEATQKIEMIVHTIQKDAQDAIGAMEISIQRVAEGAQLSDAAGQALDEITTVSNNLTSLIQNIAAQVQEKADETKAVDKSMNSIRQITEQTEQGTRQTVESLNGLQKLAGELKDSTAKFRL